MTISPDSIESFVEDNMDFGMTHEQIKNFVVNSHVTDKRKLRQTLTEISTRNHERKKLFLDIERKRIKIEQLEAGLEIEDDPYARRLMQCDIDEFKLDIGRFKIAVHQSSNELQAFMDWVNKKYNSMEELIDAAQYKEEEERKYWVARMGKQAAMDVYCTGRIGIGNLDSIAMMREEDQYATLNIAMQYSGLLNAGIGKIQNELKPQMDKMMVDGSAPRIPTFDNVEDNLDLKLYEQIIGNEQKSLQSPDQSETE
mgnify:FL=1|tara:strand:+ start:1045 stop:1809 length:765 start_codon:yes stop_codon:yes gene_type:complete